MGKKPPRSRTLRRVEERDARQQVKDRERLATLGLGGAPERPIDVPTSSVIEGRARSTPCAQCGGQLDLVDHASSSRGEPRRVVTLRCRTCHAPRTLFFRLPPPPS